MFHHLHLNGISKLGPFFRIWTLKQPFIWAGLSILAYPFLNFHSSLILFSIITLVFIILVRSKYILTGVVFFLSFISTVFIFIINSGSDKILNKSSSSIPDRFSSYISVLKLSRSKISGIGILGFNEKNCNSNFRVHFFSDGKQELKEGVRYFGEFKRVSWSQPQHPDDFNEAKYYQSLDCFINVKIEKIILIDTSFSLIGFRTKLKADLIQSLQSVFDSTAASTGFALLTGDKQFFDESQISDIRHAGLLHLFAVSGFHIGVIFTFIVGVFSRLRIGRISVFPALVIVWIYIFLIGFPISALRAGIMLSAAVWGIFYGRNILSWGNYWLAFVIIIAIWPDQIKAPGFVLSFSALAGILIFLPTINRHLNKLRKLNSPRLLIYAMSIFEISIAAQIGVLLPVTYWFGSLNMLSPFVNLFAVPLIIMLIPVTFFPVLISMVVESVPFFIALPGNIISYGVLKLSNFASIHSYLFNPWDYGWLLIILFFVLVFWYWSHRLWACKYLNYLLLIILICQMLVLPVRIPVRIIQMDVGQGDAAHIQCGSKQFLIDAGFRKKKFGMLVNKLTSKKDFDQIFISHADSDHYGGLLTSEKVPVTDKLFVSSKRGGSWYNELIDKHIKKKTAIEIPEIRIVEKDPFMRIYCLDNGRIGRKLGWDKNNSSLVLLISTPGWSYLLMGDAEGKQESFLEVWQPLIDRSILKVGHHGSKNAGSESFIGLIRPDLAIISCGKNNRFGHPDAAIIDRLEKSGANIHRTDLSGYWISPRILIPILK